MYWGAAFGQASPPSGESHKYRTIFTVAGGAGGFAVGLFAGLAVFDDATNSDRKVWTTAILAAIGGSIGGYFLGRAWDRPARERVSHGWLLNSSKVWYSLNGLVRGLIKSRGQCKVQTAKSCQLFVWQPRRLPSTKRTFQLRPLIPITSIWSLPFEECKWLPTEPLFETSGLCEHQDGGPNEHDASRLSAVSFLLVSCCQRLLVPRYAATRLPTSNQ